VVADSGFPGLAIHLTGDFATVEFEGLEVDAGAAVPLPRLARAASDQAVTGLEFFVGIPGSVGGAVRQNAGCFGMETKDRLMHAEVVSLLDGSEANLGPGTSTWHTATQPADRSAGAEGEVAAARGRPGCFEERIREITRWRRDNQPGGTSTPESFQEPHGTTLAS
jgi:UDP-N-acetylmuramate dehydrogenase